jgi:aryl-alcohol dehydrogenase-like predicted oxidoreductase
MQYRTLGHTDFSCSTIGFGAWGIGETMWIGAQTSESQKTLDYALERELTFIDTALIYGQGHSEQLVGQAVNRVNGTTPSGRAIFIATKVPPRNLEWPAGATTSWEEAFPPAHILECVEISLKNLQRDSIDLLQFHVWQDQWLDHKDSWYPAITQLKEEGKIRAFGISINDYAPETALRAVQSGCIDSVQVIYNVFAQSPADQLFALCQQHRVGVIARVPLDEGGLTGAVTPDSTFPDGDFRGRYFSGDRKMLLAQRLEPLAPLVAQAQAANLAELALRFCLSHPAVTTVIPGMRRLERIDANVRASDAGPLPDAMHAAMQKQRWERNWYRPD